MAPQRRRSERLLQAAEAARAQQQQQQQRGVDEAAAVEHVDDDGDGDDGVPLWQAVLRVPTVMTAMAPYLEKDDDAHPRTSRGVRRYLEAIELGGDRAALALGLFNALQVSVRIDSAETLDFWAQYPVVKCRVDSVGDVYVAAALARLSASLRELTVWRKLNDASLQPLTRLTALRCYYTNLTDACLPHVAGTLRVLRCSEVMTIDGVAALPHLVELVCWDNESVTKGVGRLTQLTSLTADGRLDGVDLSPLVNLRQLSGYDFAPSRSLLSGLTALTRLKCTYLHDDAALAQLVSLEHLDCGVLSTSDATLGTLTSLTYLKFHRSVGDTISDASIRRLTRLRELHFRGTMRITAESIRCLTALRVLGTSQRGVFSELIVKGIEEPWFRRVAYGGGDSTGG